MLVGCVYRPPKSNMFYPEDLCSNIDKATEENMEVFLLGDFNGNWSDTKNAYRRKLSKIAETCNLSQMVNTATRLSR